VIDPPFLQNKPENSDDSAEISTAVVVPERLVQGGAALVRTDSGVAFVEGALPDERVRIGPVHRDGGAPRAELLEICEPSPYRRIPECPLFGDCGGCDWQHLHYSEQLRWKREILAENFRRLGSVVISADEISVISGDEYGYRSRVQVHAADSGGVGFRRRNSHDTLVVSHCPVATPAINGELAGLNGAGQSQLDTRGGERTVLVEDDHGVAVGGIHREATISIDGVTVRFDPAGFAQANRHLLPDLSRALRTAWTGGALVDLYAGAGLLTALTIAGAPSTEPDNRPAIICVEPDERNARFISENLSVLGFSDTVQVVKTTAERAITGEPLKTVDADTTTVLVDPPRGGLSKAVSRWLVGARGATKAAKAGGTTRRAGAATAERIIYVSCDAAALARDVGRLNAAYHVNSVTLLDFYPQTAHIEALVVLDRRRVSHS
jgi:tRNA/tmRNA/rRNA uracil-C5-methylase (TrmA/RlmC/RlmD family)